MRKIFIILTVVFFTIVVMGYPLHPDKVKELKASGEFTRIKKILDSAYDRGLNKPQRKTISVSKDNNASRVTGTWKALIILVEFSDNLANKATHDQAYYNTFFFSEGVMPTKSVREYYQEVSNNLFDLTGDIVGWYLMPQTYAYYTDGEYGFGNYPQNAQRMVEHAIAAADGDVDFSQYDNDGDGVVDALFVVHAGGEGAGGDGWSIWSHAWGINPVQYDGVWVSGYSTEPETSKIGVYCHEFGHTLGLPDLYDYGYDSAGIGKFGLMAAGSHGGDLSHPETPVFMCAWSRYTLGWISPTNVVANLYSEGISSGTPSQDVYRMWTKGATGAQYFLIENRKKGTSFDKYLPGNGILIYHVDEIMPGNDNQFHKLVDIEAADGLAHMDTYVNSGDAGDYYPGTSTNRFFNGTSNPNSNNYSGSQTYVAVENISDSADTMTADLKVYFKAKTPTNVSIENYGSGTEAYVSWDDDSTATQYKIYYGTSPTSLDKTKNVTNNTSIVSGLNNSTTYYVKITAFNSFEWSNDSEIKSDYIYDVLPARPKNLTALPFLNEVTLKWDKVSGRDIIGYNIYMREDQEINFTKLNSSPQNSRNYIINSLLPFHRYHFYVTAIDNTGNESAESKNVSVQVLTQVKYFIRNNVLDKSKGETAVYIDLSLFSDTKVKIQLYSISGELIKTLKEERLSAGYHLITWEGVNSKGSNVSSGVYLLSIQLGFKNYFEKVVLLK